MIGKKIEYNKQTFEAIFRIIHCDESNGYYISNEDRELRNLLIEEYLSRNEKFNRCKNHNPDTKLEAFNNCNFPLQDSFNNLKDKVVKPNTLENIIRLEYINYLFHIVFKNDILEKYEDDPTFHEMLVLEYTIFRSNSMVVEYQHVSNYPMMEFEHSIRVLINMYSDELVKENIDLYSIDVDFMRKEIEKERTAVALEACYCFNCFKEDYLRYLIQRNFELLNEWFRMEIERIKNMRITKNNSKRYKLDKKRLKEIRRISRKRNKRRMSKRLEFIVKKSGVRMKLGRKR